MFNIRSKILLKKGKLLLGEEMGVAGMYGMNDSE